jgi:hypothetical protein
MTTTNTIKPGDYVLYDGMRGAWLVKKVVGDTLTVTNPFTHGGRFYLDATKCVVTDPDY